MTEAHGIQTSATLDLDDIQGNLLRGYHLGHAQHLAVQVGLPENARSLLADLIDGRAAGLPQVTCARLWEKPGPSSTLNLGLTFAGLQALGVSASVLDGFPAAFRQGPGEDKRAAALGDVGASAPSGWELGAPGATDAHLLLSVHARSAAALDAAVAVLRRRVQQAGARVLWSRGALSLANDRVHFGYRDGIAQPRIAGAGKHEITDAQPEAPAGDFLLGGGHVNSFGGNHLGDLPPALCDNATYGAFRVLYQDAAAFERFIRLTGRRWHMEPEQVAAKLMGRWRNGVPLSRAPASAYAADGSLDPAVGKARLNDFDYAPTASNPERYDDRIGLRCPVGAHIRRLNPRSAMVTGKPHSRRLVRRAMPYGPEYDARDPYLADDGVDRGLVGYFLCGDLELQFEFLQRVWVNEDMSAPGLRGTREPILGAQPPQGGKFVIRTEDPRDPIVISDLPNLVTTRGALYCLLPGLRGLRYLSELA